MKKYILIILLSFLIISLLIIGIFYLNNKRNNNLTVELFLRDMEDISSEIKYKKVELTSKQQHDIVKYYKNTNTKTKHELNLAFLGSVKLKFSDGNTITFDDNDDYYADYNNQYIIKISSKFKKYVLDIIK